MPPFAPYALPQGFPMATPMVPPWTSHNNTDSIRQQLMLLIDPELKLQASEWNEYKTPEGKCYYFSSKTQQSVWEKPKILIDLEGMKIL